MNPYQRYAPLGLVVAGLAALTAFGLYVVQQEWNTPLQISVALVVLGLAAFVLLDPDRTRQLLSGRQARYGSNAFVLSMAFLGIVVVLNFLIYQNAQDWKLRWDLTEDQEHTLAPETQQALAALPEKVVVRAYYSPLSPGGADQAKDLLDDFKFFSGGNFDYEVINPDENPLAATQDNVTRDGTLVIQMGENREQVTLVNEQEITSALIRLMNPNKQKIYFLIGHGEFNFEDTGDISLNQLKTTLEDRNYIPEPLNLLAVGAVPEDASVLVAAGPKLVYSDQEVALIQQFLDQGGALIALFEPVPLTQFGNQLDPLTAYLESSWGITLGNDLIVDPLALQNFGTFAAIANQYQDHVIIQKNRADVTIFPTARSVRTSAEVDGITKIELILTAPQAWAETDFVSIQNQQISPDEGADLLGPVPLAVVASNAQTGSRVVVVGDSEFALNANYNFYGNGALMVNMVDWAAQQEDIINLTSDPPTQRLLLPPQRATMGLILLGTVFLLPGLALLAGILVWVQRRRRA